MNLPTHSKTKHKNGIIRQNCPNFALFKSQNSICYQSVKDDVDKDKKNQLLSQMKKISQKLSEGLHQKNQNPKSRIVVLSKLKMSIKGQKYFKNEQYSSKQPKKKCSVVEIASNDSYHKNKLNNKDELRLVNDQIKKLSLMATGIQQYQSKNQKNKMDKILSICKKQSQQLMKQNSESKLFLNLISQISQSIQNVLDEKQQNMRKIKNILAHLGEKRKFENSLSLPISPEKSGIKSNNFLKQNKQIVFQSQLKHNLNYTNRKFNFKINQLCHQIKNKQAKFNNYFKQMGDHFNISNKNNLGNVFDRFKVQIQCEKPKNIYYKSKKPATARNSLRSSTQKQQTSNDNKVPMNLLKKLKNFYESQKQLSKRSKSKDCNSRQINNLITNKKDNGQFSDEKMCMNSAKSERNQQKNISQRKDLKICEKIMAIQKQRKQIKEGNKILPINVFPVNFSALNLFSEECGYNKIVQYF